MQLNPPRIQAWADALRSGLYVQGLCGLREWERRGPLLVLLESFDALGVACDVHRIATVGGGEWVGLPDPHEPASIRRRYGCYLYLGKQGYLPDAVIEWYGLGDRDPKLDIGSVTALNDRWPKQKPFDQIADAIERTYGLVSTRRVA
jgi:hypothetical protein